MAWEDGEQLEDDDLFSDALLKYEEALRHGDNDIFRWKRARVLNKQERWGAAIRELDCAVVYAPWRADLYAQRGVNLTYLATSLQGAARTRLLVRGKADVRRAVAIDSLDLMSKWAVKWMREHGGSLR